MEEAFLEVVGDEGTVEAGFSCAVKNAAFRAAAANLFCSIYQRRTCIAKMMSGEGYE